MTGSSVVEWIWRRDAIARAREHKVSVEQRRCLERARAAANLADTAHDGLDAMSSDAANALSVGLYGQAAYWALRSLEGNSARQDAAELFANAPAELVAEAAGDRTAWERLRERFSRGFVEYAQAPAEEKDEDARLARQFVDELLARVASRYRSVRSLWVERVVRIVLVAMIVPVIAFGARLVVRPKSYAIGHPWLASSSNGDWPRSGSIGNGRRPFFHTINENEPWLQIDLEQPRKIGAIEVENRGDCCVERAVPLIVELSLDGKSWEEVARRGEVFARWTAEFAPRTARYVRLRAARMTVLHLDDVQVLPPR